MFARRELSEGHRQELESRLRRSGGRWRPREEPSAQVGGRLEAEELGERRESPGGWRGLRSEERAAGEELEAGNLERAQGEELSNAALN